MPGMSLGEVASRSGFTCHVGVDVDGLAYPLHRPTARSYQMRG
jgi:hypothetical protein